MRGHHRTSTVGLGAAVLALSGLVALGPAATAVAATRAPAVRTAVRAAPEIKVGGGGDIEKSSNWSGYAETAGGYHAVTGTWVVPTGRPTTGSRYAAQWIGIDGDGDDDLIQTGTMVEVVDGSVSYAPWWEILPASATFIDKPVAPGQTMTASIVRGTSGWVITLSNGTWTFTITKQYSGPGKSVEWIDEAPEVGGAIVDIAKTTKVTFSSLTANGANPDLVHSDAIELVQHGKVRESPSVPSSTKNAFTMAYGATAPPAP